MGSIYKRGKTWWIQYYQNGKPYQESSKSKKKMVAVTLLKQREGDISKGKMPGIHFDRVKFSELVDGLITDYELKGQERPRTAHIEKFFNGKAIDVTTTRIKKYINHRLEWTCEKCQERFPVQDTCPFCGSDHLEPGAKPATINRELSALKRMFNLGANETPPKVDRVPHIPMLKESNVKQGYFEDEDYKALLEKLPDYLRGPVQFAYLTGWRREQIMGITWGMVDRQERLVTVPEDMTKNKEPHTVYLNDPLLDLINEKFSLRRLGCPYVFHQDGKRIKDFRRPWNKACRELGLGYGYKLTKQYTAKWEKKGLKLGPTLHDFRRTAVRNFNSAGIPENIAMKITGHKTNSTYKRYGIVSKEDLKWAAEKQAKRMESQ